ncbi:MAG: hypothetical protein HY059_03575 [Proteobacteria bacterium]|nr:hypothetical protein [Pseudomonadota bacterium]
MRARLLAIAAAALLAAGCSDVSRVDTPVTGQLSWFAFLGGEDIRAACVPGSPAHYRFVYNAVLDEQLRSYDLVQTQSGATFEARVPNANPTLFEYRPNAAVGWNPRRADKVSIDRPAYLAIARQLEEDGFGAAPDTRRNLPSWDFYWIVTACADGRFHINAWLRATPGFDALGFPALLYAQDRTEIPINPVSRNPYADYRTKIGQGMPDRNFDVRLTPTGLSNLGQPF